MPSVYYDVANRPDGFLGEGIGILTSTVMDGRVENAKNIGLHI